MQEIPKPELLNPDRIDRDDREDMTLEDHRSRSQLLAAALAESCGYADQLWDQLNRVRAYLLDSLPPDPRRPGAHDVVSASPTGPDDEQGWQHWIDAFATTTSTLCGAHGDSGFGLSRARQEAQARRTSPELTLHAAQADRTASEPPDGEAAEPEPAAALEVSRTDEHRRSTAKFAAMAALVALAIRGLLPGRRQA